MFSRSTLPRRRVLQVQENRDVILLKVAVAILAECEGDLLMQEVRPRTGPASPEYGTPGHGSGACLQGRGEDAAVPGLRPPGVRRLQRDRSPATAASAPCRALSSC